MNSNRKKIIALAVLATVWGALAVWQWLTVAEPVRVPLSNVSGRPSAQQPSRGATGSLQVQLALLASSRTQRDMTFTTPRNIFALPLSVEIGSAAVDPASDLSADQQSIVADLAQFHYLGFVRTGEDGEKTRDLAVLTKNDDLHLVRKGETVEQHVLVKAINQESVTLQDRNSRLEYTVLLSEEAVAQP